MLYFAYDGSIHGDGIARYAMAWLGVPLIFSSHYLRKRLVARRT